MTASTVVSASTASTSELRNAVVTAGAAVVQFTSGTGSSTFLHLCHPLTLSRMTACPLTQNENEHDHQHRKDRRGDWTAQGEPTMFYGLVQEIANGGASGRVRINAAQNSRTRDIFVQK